MHFTNLPFRCQNLWKQIFMEKYGHFLSRFSRGRNIIKLKFTEMKVLNKIPPPITLIFQRSQLWCVVVSYILKQSLASSRTFIMLLFLGSHIFSTFYLPFNLMIFTEIHYTHQFILSSTTFFGHHICTCNTFTSLLPFPLCICIFMV